MRNMWKLMGWWQLKKMHMWKAAWCSECSRASASNANTSLPVWPMLLVPAWWGDVLAGRVECLEAELNARWLCEKPPSLNQKTLNSIKHCVKVLKSVRFGTWDIAWVTEKAQRNKTTLTRLPHKALCSSDSAGEDLFPSHHPSVINSHFHLAVLAAKPCLGNAACQINNLVKSWEWTEEELAAGTAAQNLTLFFSQ